MKIISINIAEATNVSLNKSSPKKFLSGIFKKPVSKPVFLDYIGFEGDGVGDRRIHGGTDKAVCVYSVDHFQYWGEKLKREILPGAFGENLSLEGMLETQVNIGDIFEVGKAQVEVTQPRQPCHKLNKVFEDQSMACNVQTTGFSGFYLRVLKPGLVEPGAILNRIHEGHFSIEKANALLRRGGKNIQHMRELINIKALSEEWKDMFQKRLLKS